MMISVNTHVHLTHTHTHTYLDSGLARSEASFQGRRSGDPDSEGLSSETDVEVDNRQ
jgi:hypothetical protein